MSSFGSDGCGVIDLAPHNPYGLALQSPVIVAPGCAAPLRDPDSAQLGAIVTRTAVLHGRYTPQSRFASVPAGVVFERLPVTRLRTLLQTEAKRWARLSLPVLLCLQGTADELAEMAVHLEALDALAGVVIEVQAEQAQLGVTAVRDQTALPLLVMLPAETPEIAAECVGAGADALIVQAYPHVAAVANGEVFEGQLLGPTLAPRTLHALRRAAELVEVPLLAFGGVADEQIARQCLLTGATGVLVDGALYGDPYAPQRIGLALRGASGTGS